MMHTQRIGWGPNAIEISVSDVYGDPVREFSETRALWERLESLRWCPESKPQGWWWRKWIGRVSR